MTNTSTRCCNAPASTASPDAPITPPPWGRGRGTTVRESGRGSRGGDAALSGRWWRNGVVGLGSGQRECCGVGEAPVAGWDDDSGGCAIALLGQWWHCWGMRAVTDMDRWALRCRNRRATAAGVKGMLQSPCCWVFATSSLKLLQLPQSLEPPPHYLSAIYPHMESVLNRRWWHHVSGSMVGTLLVRRCCWGVGSLKPTTNH